ncbi:Putative major facilitator superfamily, MFS transporter superfamily [Septoria linicola]|uniref:Major facilitator superfamily, MFS transporter superfamily n=1 Tax=Septoria linicola TaxID=215465 RepID=A0A9Q9AW30_9PEZI|nr:putative major facilitator superfamily, MFS transporter superfamily [Septoria linicola]USW52881.1 Putative major facilitator superfamily, MFS transporter superfamily [Septoria linicola]
MAIGSLFTKSAKADVPTPPEKADIPSYGEYDSQGGVQIEDVHAPRLVDEETEKRLIRKLDKRIIPMVMWMYLMSFMDRVNIGNARLYGLEEDLGMVQNQYQLAVSILFVTYCLFEAPSNMILKKARPRWHLAFLTLAWGLVATFSAMTQSFVGLVVCRLLLGLFEAGLFPGLVVYLTIFYNKKHIATRNAYLFGTAAIAGAAGGLLNYGLGFLDNAAGWSAWRWIFLSEEDQRKMILLRQQEVGQSLSAQECSKQDSREAFRDWKVWAMGAAQYAVNSMLYSFSIFLPTIIRDMNSEWSAAIVQLLTIPVHLSGAMIYLGIARLSDKTQVRGPYCIGFNWIAIFGYVMLLPDLNPALSYAGCFLVSWGCYLSVGLPMSWLAANNPRYGKRTTATGIQLTLGNASGVGAPFLYGSQYGPQHYVSYGASASILLVSSMIYSTVHVYWRSRNKRKIAGKEDHIVAGMTPEEQADAGDRNPKYLFTI